MAKILLVEDDESLKNSLVQFLALQKHIVEAGSNGVEGLELFVTYDYDLIILDWTIPHLSGLELCKRIRARGGAMPILFLTGKDSLLDKEAGFNAGADDYLTKPFHMQELALRIRALLRRPPILSQTRLKLAHLELDSETHEVWKEGKEIRLTRTEFAILEGLMRNPSRLFSSENILEKFWPANAEKSADALRTCLKKLRQKIDMDGEDSIIKNIHGVGYKLESKPDAQSE